MLVENVQYQGFCWVIGTTSFRTAQLNLKIEQQLLILDELALILSKEGKPWKWNKEVQIRYYDLMKESGFLTGNAKIKDKDARQKTSGLVDIGLLTKDDRTITQAGRALLEITKQSAFKTDNLLDIEADSYIYLKQLLKTSIEVGNTYARPYIILAKLLTELDYLSYEEFKYILPICSSYETTQNIINKIREFRRIGRTDIDEVIYNTLKLLSNYEAALQYLLEVPEVTEDVICTIGMNRKSKTYDKPYFKLYSALVGYFISGSHDLVDLFDAVESVRLSKHWRELIFKSNITRNALKKHNAHLTAFNPKCPFVSGQGLKALKATFFKYLHVYKAKSTLDDYFDLNRRYFSLTNTLVFQDERVVFELLPKHFFKLSIEDAYNAAFEPSTCLHLNVSIEEIHKAFNIEASRLYASINGELDTSITSSADAKQIVKDIRYERLHRLLDEKLSKDTLLELLDCFETRDDRRIEDLVTKDADIPTIFEYVLGMAWYEISGRQGDILHFMKLSLDANLLPKTHAAGGSADIIYEYLESDVYPRHDLLIEATLTESSNQRRAEMEPVSRHLGNHLIETGNKDHYCVFVSTNMHVNVMGDFRSRKDSYYYGTDTSQYVKGMKIIPLTSRMIKDVLDKGVNYEQLYPFFEEQHQIDKPPVEWWEGLERGLSSIKPS